MTPEIQYGESKVKIGRAEDGTGWTCKQQPNTHTFGELSFDATLSANDYLMVGCWFSSKETFGKECFVRVDETKPVQRLLVIRTIRQQTEGVGPEIAQENLPPRTVAAVAQATRR
jgi:hypothetical protein